MCLIDRPRDRRFHYTERASTAPAVTGNPGAVAPGGLVGRPARTETLKTRDPVIHTLRQAAKNRRPALTGGWRGNVTSQTVPAGSKSPTRSRMLSRFTLTLLYYLL
jgi:hypothetical protein